MEDGKTRERENGREVVRGGRMEDGKGGSEGVVNDRKISIGISYRAGFTIGLPLQRSGISKAVLS